MGEFADALRAAKLVGGGIVALALMVAILSPAMGALTETAEQRVTGQALFGYDDRAQVRPRIGESLRVEQSLGTQLQLDGSGGVTTTTDSDSVGSFAFCSLVTLDSASLDTNQTIAIYDGEQHLQFAGNRSTDHFVGTWYNPVDRVTYDVAINTTAAGLDPTTPTHLCLEYDGNTTLTLFANTSNATVSVDGSHTTTDGGVSGFDTLDGRVDETRLYNGTLTSSERQTLRTTPTAPLANPPGRVIRVMYDVRRPVGDAMPDIRVYFDGATAEVDKGTVASGPAGQATDGDDYRVRQNGDQLVATDGGTLDGAPTAFLVYQGAGSRFAVLFDTVVSIGGSALRLLVVAVLIIAAAGAVEWYDEF